MNLHTQTTSKTNGPWTRLLSARYAFALLLAFAMLIVAGCDSNGDDDPPPPGPEPGTSVNYDTTEAGVITITENDGEGIRPVDADGNTIGVDDGENITWTNDFTYRLDGFVFVNDGQTLNIEPGTLVQGLPGSGEDASALIVARGAQIVADGNPGSDDPADADPIVFTSSEDDGSGLARDARGLWGGVILLGDAELNSSPGETAIEGVPAGDRTLYGGDDNDHDVGVFRFVSIRHTGTQLGNGDEIQGLTLGGLGSGSTIEYVESYASGDDGFEWFGGTVNTRYMIAAWAADDAYDTDEGFRGNNQFWLAVQNVDIAGRASEQDGGTDPETGTPLGAANIANATYIGVGPGVEGTAGDGNNPFVIHRDNNANSYYNSVFMGARFNAGLQIEDLESGGDSRERWEEGTLEYRNTLWWNIGPGYGDDTAFEDIIQLTSEDYGQDFRSELADYLREENNELLDLDEQPIASIDRQGNGLITSFNPLAAGPADSGAPSLGDLDGDGVNGDLEDVDFYGAFGDSNWARGWTLLSQSGQLVD